MKRRNDKKMISIILLCMIITCISTATSCKRAEPETPIEITLMHGWGGTLKTHNTMQQIYSQFSKENPDIILKSSSYSDSSIAVEKANDMLAVGKMPDILSTNGLSYYVNNAVKRNMAMDLMPYIKADASLKSAIHPSVFKTWTTNETHLYTIPDALEVAGYWYNVSYLEQAGVTDSLGNANLPETWEEFFIMVTTLKEWTNGKPIVVCSLDPQQISEYLFQARLAGENENGKAATEDSSVVLNSDTLQRTMEDISKLCLLSEQVNNIENARQNFSDGQSALYFNGVWESNSLADSKNAAQFQYAAYPGLNGMRTSYVSPSSGYVFATQTDEKKAKACIRFLKYMLSEKVQMEIADKTGQAPSNPKVSSQRVEKENPMLGNAIRTAYDTDIWLKTISSVWPEEKLQTVRQFCNLSRNGWDARMNSDMLAQLNSDP